MVIPFENFFIYACKPTTDKGKLAQDLKRGSGIPRRITNGSGCWRLVVVGWWWLLKSGGCSMVVVVGRGWPLNVVAYHTTPQHTLPHHTTLHHTTPHHATPHHTTGAVAAVLVGVATGFLIGMFLLFGLIVARKRCFNRSAPNKYDIINK